MQCIKNARESQDVKRDSGHFFIFAVQREDEDAEILPVGNTKQRTLLVHFSPELLEHLQGLFGCSTLDIQCSGAVLIFYSV